MKRLIAEWWPLVGTAVLLGCTFAFLIVPSGGPR